VIDAKQALNIQQLVSTTGTNLRSHSITTFNHYDRRIKKFIDTHKTAVLTNPAKASIRLHQPHCYAARCPGRVLLTALLLVALLTPLLCTC
jgi:hypothetical protein